MPHMRFVCLGTRPPDVAPSLHRHDSDFITTTSNSVPVPRIGTQVLVGSPRERLPSHRDDWVPQFPREAWTRLTPPARRTPPGQPSGQPPDFSRRYHPPSVSMSCPGSRRVNGGSLAFVFLIHTCRVMLDVSPTLTTATLHDSRLGWFEACDQPGSRRRSRRLGLKGAIPVADGGFELFH